MTINYTTAQGVQQFSITISAAKTTGTATVNSVGSGAFILWGGFNPSTANAPTKDFAYLTKTSATVITATRNTSGGTVVINGCIIDGDTTNLIKSVQYGTVTIAAAAQTGTASISAVTNNNAAVHLLGWSSANATYSGIDEDPILTLSGTTVTATIADALGGGGGLVVGFVVIEFQGAALNQSVQNVAATHTGSATSYTATITSVNTNNAIMIYAGSNTSVPTTDFAEIMQNGQLTAATTVTVDCNTGVALNVMNYNCSVVEFASGVLNSNVQRGTTTLTGVTSATTNITSVNENYAGVTWDGNTSNTTATDVNRAYGAASLGAGTINTCKSAALTTTNANDLIIVAISFDPNITPASVDSPYTLGAGASGAYQITAATVASQSANFHFATSGIYSSSTASFKNSGTIAFIQNSGLGAGGTSATATLSSTTASNFLVVSVACQNAGVSSVSDNKSQTWIQVPGAAAGSGSSNDPYTDIWYVPNNVGGVTSVTVTIGSASGLFIDVYEFSGVASSSLIDTVTNITNASSTANDGVTVTKNNATGNITGSWEVFEFPAYVYTGTFSSTASKDSMSATGLTGSGSTSTFAATAIKDAMAATGVETFTGSLAPIAAADIMAATAKLTFSGVLSPTAAADLMAAMAKETFSGVLASTAAKDVMAATGIETFTAALAVVAHIDAMAASGTITGAGSTSTFASTGQPDIMTAIGAETFTGSLAPTAGKDAMAAQATETFLGALSPQAAKDFMAAAAAETFSGALAATGAPDFMAAMGAVIQNITGTLAATAAPDSMSASGSITLLNNVVEWIIRARRRGGR